ncbi:hypothetical protein JL720_12354 [Aureococcus anophagefferens]|nr:hypothetical protein JL720_12354 [Aureococcus anophagefferens]
MAALFPRGSLPDTPQDDKKKEKKRKVVADEVLFGTHKSKGDEAPQKKSKETEALDMISQGAVKAGSKGRPAKLVKVQFASYHSEMSALGVVRSASAKNALVSLPGNLVGHVDLVSGDSAGLTLKAGAVVRCAVLRTSRAGAAPGAARSVELTAQPRSVQRGVRLEDLAKGRVAALCGAVTSAEARGYVVDVGVAGATGFLKRGDCDGELAAGALVECRVLKVDAESGVVALARDGAVADAANGGNAKKWTLQALCVGQRVAATVARKLPNGVTVTFCDGMLAGCVVRLTCVPHLVSLGGAAVDGGELALPAVGSFERRAVVRRVDPRVGAVLAFDHGDTEIGAFVHVSRWPGAAEKKAKKKKAGDGDDGSSDDDEDRLEVGAEVDCRVVGAAPLEGWALCSMVKQSMDPEVPLGKDELEAGALLKATVLAVKSWGVEARLSETLTGSLTNMHVAESGGVDPRKHAKKGDVIDVRVLRVEARRVELTAKRSLVKDAGAKLASYADAKQRVGGSFVGFVTGADATRGLTVTFYANVHGRVSPESLRERGVSDAAEAFPSAPASRWPCAASSPRRGPTARRSAAAPRAQRRRRPASSRRDADVAPGQRFDAARVTELVVTKPKKKRAAGAAGAPAATVAAGLCRVARPDGSSFLAKLPAALACDHGALAGDVLRRLGAGDKPTFPCVVVEGPGGGAVAKIAAAPAILAAASGGDFPTAAEDLALNTIYVGAVTAVKPYGAFVAFGGGLRGLVPRSLVADKFIASVEECFAVGDVVRCCVDKIEDDGKILLRTRGVPRDGAGAFGASLFEAAAAIVDAGAPPFYAGVALGASYDALVEAVDADGRVACNVVKPGRGKKRKEGLKALAAGAAVDAADALDAQAFPPPGAGAALALDRATGALVIASVGDFHRRGEAVPAAVEGFVPRHRRGSIAVDPDAGDEERARRPAGKKHLPATDVAALEVGDAVHGRVIKVSAEAIALSVRVEGGEDARVRCQLHASDCFVASVARVSDAPEAMTEPSSTLGAAHPFHDVRQGAVLHCVLLAKRQDKGLTLLDLGLGKKCARKGRGADDVAAYLAQAGASGACLPAGDADAQMVKGTAHVSLRPSRLARASTAPDAKPKVGDVRPGFVVGADKKAGVFVELARNVVGRVLLKDLADSYVADVPGTFPVGRLVAPVVTRVADDGKLDLSLRPSAIDKEGAVVASIDVGDVLTGLVTRVEAYGVFVKLDDAPRDAASGLAHKSQLSDDFVKDVATLFAKGDRVKAKVLKIDEPAEPGGRRKLSLGLKPSYFDGDDAAMAASDDDDSDGDDDALARADALLADDSGDDDDAMEEDDDDEEDSDEEEGDDVGGLVEDEAEESGDDDDESDDDLDEEEEEEEEEEAGALRWEEDAPAAPSRKKAKKAETSEAALVDEADAAESALLADAGPRTAEDYERLLVTEWNAAATWIAYAKLLVTESDATGARGVLERALKKIGYREEAQRLEAWAALLAHERDHGDAKSLSAAVDRATKNADPTRVLLKLAALHEETSNYDAADAAYARAEKRSRRQGATPDDACADGGPKAEASLLAKFACLELDVGSADRGRTLFDTTLAKWPKRADLWQLYVAKSLKAGDVAHARAIQMRLAGVNLPPKAMRAALKRFAAFEEAHGDAASADAVKDLARAYVQKQQAAMDEDD